MNREGSTLSRGKKIGLVGCGVIMLALSVAEAFSEGCLPEVSGPGVHDALVYRSLYCAPAGAHVPSDPSLTSKLDVDASGNCVDGNSVCP